MQALADRFGSNGYEELKPGKRGYRPRFPLVSPLCHGCVAPPKEPNNRRQTQLQ